MKVFRRLRESLIPGTKIKKYLLYGIGETVLVVVGILIALQVNNYKEQSETTTKIEAIFETVAIDLSEDIKEANEIIEFYTKRDSIILRIINDTLPAEMFKEDANLRTVILFYNELLIDKMGYEALMRNINDVPIEYSDVLTHLNKLYSQAAPRIETNNKSTRAFLEQLAQKWSKHSWFLTSRETQKKWNDGLIKYMSEDPNYKSDVRMYKMIAIDNLLGTAYFYKLYATSALFELGTCRNLTFDEAIETYIQNIGPLVQTLPIQSPDISIPNTCKKWVTIFLNNSSAEQVNVSLINLNTENTKLPARLPAHNILPHTSKILLLKVNQNYLVNNQNGDKISGFNSGSADAFLSF